MWEQIPGVDIRYVKGDNVSLNNVLKAKIRLFYNNATDTTEIDLGNTKLEVGPAQLPPGFTLTKATPPYEVEAELSANSMAIKGQAEVLAWVIGDPKTFRSALMTYFGNDTVTELLGALNTTVKNLNAEPIIIREEM